MNSSKTHWAISGVSTLYLLLMVSATTQAQPLSFQDAESYLLESSLSTQASQALQQAAQLEADALKGLGLPRMDLNVRAYSFHSEVDIPLQQFKNNLESTISQGINGQISQWESNQNLPAGMSDPLQQGIGNVLHNGIGMIPDTSNVILEDQVIRPTVSVTLPLYTGGLTQSAKSMASIQANRSELNSKQEQDTQRFELIHAYFNVQLQRQLEAAARLNLSAMQKHQQNALKLERQGFISKGQRMQFEVAQNNALRSQQNSTANVKAALFKLNNLLRQGNVIELSTPLFVNRNPPDNINQLLANAGKDSALVQKMQLDTELAKANIKAQQATQKPNVFAFGEYSIDNKQNWIVGVAARYNLFSGIDKSKNMQAAELKRYASELLTARTQQEIETLIYKSYTEAVSAQQSDSLLQENLKAAQENLRIQELSFREDMGTATQVIDAQNILSSLKAESALNAYKYVMALATLLQSQGQLERFPQYLHQVNTHHLR